MNKKIKIAISMFLVTAILGAGIFLGVRKSKMNEYKNAQVALPKGFTITAHTGCMKTEENSLESIRKGVENGASIVEFDLYFNEKGEPILSHDKPVGGEVTLDEAFEYISKIPDIKVNIDIKVCDALQKIYPTAQKYGIQDRIFYTGVKDEFVDCVRNNSPQVKYFLNVDVQKSKNTDEIYLLSLVEKVKNAGAVGINFNYKSASRELVEVFRSNGLLVSIWTVDDEYNMYKILSFEPDNMTTRHPDELSEIVNKMQVKF